MPKKLIICLLILTSLMFFAMCNQSNQSVEHEKNRLQNKISKLEKQNKQLMDELKDKELLYQDEKENKTKEKTKLVKVIKKKYKPVKKIKQLQDKDLSVEELIAKELGLEEIADKKKLAKDKNLFHGDWKPFKKRISAANKYLHLLKRLKVPKDKDDFTGQLPYIKYGYWDHGYLPEQKEYKKYKNIPAGFWVYVFPNWYVWEKENPNHW